MIVQLEGQGPGARLGVHPESDADEAYLVACFESPAGDMLWELLWHAAMRSKKQGGRITIAGRDGHEATWVEVRP